MSLFHVRSSLRAVSDTILFTTSALHIVQGLNNNTFVSSHSYLTQDILWVRKWRDIKGDKHHMSSIRYNCFAPLDGAIIKGHENSRPFSLRITKCCTWGRKAAILAWNTFCRCWDRCPAVSHCHRPQRPCIHCVRVCFFKLYTKPQTDLLGN